MMSKVKKCMLCGYIPIKQICNLKASFSTSSITLQQYSKFVIIGGGTGGITMASRIRHLGEKDITIIEPSEV